MWKDCHVIWSCYWKERSGMFHSFSKTSEEHPLSFWDVKEVVSVYLLQYFSYSVKNLWFVFLPDSWIWKFFYFLSHYRAALKRKAEVLLFFFVPLQSCFEKESLEWWLLRNLTLSFNYVIIWKFNFVVQLFNNVKLNFT